jgi:hypothetical protein
VSGFLDGSAIAWSFLPSDIIFFMSKDVVDNSKLLIPPSRAQ